MSTEKITLYIIYDNYKTHESFQEGWGFSCLVDTGYRKILFDTGANSKAFFSNLEKFNIQCNEITDVVFSHKHKDHIAGLEEILGKLGPKSRLFLPKKFPLKNNLFSVEINKVQDFTEIDSGIFSLVLKGGFRLYEQALVLQTRNGIVIITGCAPYSYGLRRISSVPKKEKSD